jgi:hypothetical protein
MAGFVGSYTSDEANTTVEVIQDSTGALVLHRDPDLHMPLRPSYRDGFRSPAGMVVFGRDASGRVNEFRFTTGRVRNLRFARR